MKKIVLHIVLFTLLSLQTNAVFAEKSKPITHVIIIWLKEPGNEQHREKLVKASKLLDNLPGIIHRHVGVVRPSDRKIVDDSFDIAISVTLESEKALTAYLKSPKHTQILHDHIKPLVDKTVAYDFISP